MLMGKNDLKIHKKQFKFDIKVDECWKPFEKSKYIRCVKGGLMKMFEKAHLKIRVEIKEAVNVSGSKIKNN